MSYDGINKHTPGVNIDIHNSEIKSLRMTKEPSLQEPQIEFVQNFLQPDQIQRMLIYFSKQRPTDSNAQYGFTDVIVRLINDPLSIVFGQHGIYLFSNYLIIYPYNELDTQQVSYITQFLSMHMLNSMNNTDTATASDAPTIKTDVPSMKIDMRITKQMGGGYTVRPLQLTNIRLDSFNVLKALVRGIMCGSQKHNTKYRQHAINLQLQRILTRIVISRSQIQDVNAEIEKCIQKQEGYNTEECMSTDVCTKEECMSTDVCTMDTPMECA